MTFKIVNRDNLPIGDGYFLDWAVVDADGKRVYPAYGAAHRNDRLSSTTLQGARDILNRSPLSYHMLRLYGLSPIEAARHILEQTE